MKLILFDLDGTLVDSGSDIARSVNELLTTCGRRPLPEEQIVGYVGDGVRKLLQRAMGDMPDEDLSEAEALYLSVYRRRLLETTVPYEGVVPALEELHRNRPLAVLTNKPEKESLMILEGLGLRRYFRFVYGGDSFARKKPDPMGALHVLRETGTSPSEALLVGDSRVDLETAGNAGIHSCLVTYGLASIADLRPEPDFVIDDLRELLALVQSG